MDNLATRIRTYVTTNGKTMDDVVIQDDGNGPYLVQEAWPFEDLAIPTDTQLAAIDADAVIAKAALRAQIVQLEATITPRRQREAILTDAGRTWLNTKDAAIKALRDEMGTL